MNPAIGATYDLRPKRNVYLSYNEGLRAPSPIELTCADPLASCRLPNNFLADPPLDPVVSKTWEGGCAGSSQRTWNGARPSYAVMHLDARYRFIRNWELFGRVNNLFDKDYEAFGVLGQNFFNGSGRSFDATLAAPEQFVTPAAPRAGWIGIRYLSDARKERL